MGPCRQGRRAAGLSPPRRPSQTAGRLETGASLFEFKVARLPSVDCDIRTVHEVREAVGPKVEIAVDANMSYDREQARRFIAETKTANLANIEEPVASLSETARLRDRLRHSGINPLHHAGCAGGLPCHRLRRHRPARYRRHRGGDPWTVTEGGCRPPERPGLGIDLDRTALERYGAS